MTTQPPNHKRRALMNLVSAINEYQANGGKIAVANMYGTRQNVTVVLYNVKFEYGTFEIVEEANPEDGAAS